MSIDHVSRVLIVGGGVGGLSAAISLARQGVAVDLIERNTEWGALGAGLTFNGATARAFRDLGVLEAVLAAGSGHGPTRMCDTQGNVIVDSDPAAEFEPGLPAAGGILRPVLHEILKSAALAHGVVGRVGLSVVALEDRGDTVQVRFSDGSSDSFDLVVGADGLTSTTRALILGPQAPSPWFTGQVCWRAVTPRPPEVRTGELYLGGAHKVGINPISATQMYMFALVHDPANAWVPSEDWPSRLRDVLAGYGGHIGRIRDELDDQRQIIYRPLEGLLVPLPWHRGRAILIGDAVHATTPHIGYGAGLAVEDGIVLAEELASHASVAEALEAFEARRFPRCAAVVNGSLEIGRMEMAGASPMDQRELAQRVTALVHEPI
jgi:2-polyprenyl-6-methoxyphenol hydroxylase-like FAD-dependent oxidoreductase